jgi:hypothetical protein
MKDSKLTPFQQRQLQAQMESKSPIISPFFQEARHADLIRAEGSSLPSKVNPTSSKPPAAATPSKPKVRRQSPPPACALTCGTVLKSLGTAHSLFLQPKAVDASGGGKRQLAAIVESGAYNAPEPVIPAPGARALFAGVVTSC